MLEYVRWCVQNIHQNANPLVQDLCLQYTQSFLSCVEYRIGFYQQDGAMQAIVEGMRNSTSAQMQYQFVYCLWMLTFSKDVSNDIVRYKSFLFY